eukprot:TRINITY_DN10544_c0_g1_i1.p1 TRINITY_DN10544_c0_g1~~TRINITY_DN10544_c0_g1_i1.p1  ORF type:complete len:336 (+),score=85.13 TRINITY_DN10544_c0_g1_i1:144-1151(+)
MCIRDRSCGATALLDPKAKDRGVSAWLSLVVTAVSLLGAAVLVMDPNRGLLSGQDARTIAAMSVLLLITWNRHFSRIFLAFFRAFRVSIPVVLAIVSIVILYALATEDLFRDKVIDPDTGKPYFDTYSHSMSTLFRMFAGHWQPIMEQCVTATTEAAQLWFSSFMFVVTIFAGNLFVGVIMSGCDEVNTVKSPRFYAIRDFEKIFDFNLKDRTQIMDSLLVLNRTLAPYNQQCRKLLSLGEKQPFQPKPPPEFEPSSSVEPTHDPGLQPGVAPLQISDDDTETPCEEAGSELARSGSDKADPATGDAEVVDPAIVDVELANLEIDDLDRWFRSVR